MRTSYSPYFALLHDQDGPVGHLGRGAHYSVLRAASWQSLNLAPSSEAVFHDFAVIWDEDHDDRVIRLAERIYFSGLLAPVLALGERKGCVTILISGEAKDALGSSNLRKYEERLEKLAVDVDGDTWSVRVYRFGDRNPIIDAAEDAVDLYLRHIDLLWTLGPKPVSTGVPV